MRRLDVAIAGAGIAGLAAAIAFALRGHRIRLYEQAPQLTEIGAGLQLSPNATRILDRLGVLGRLETAAARPQAVRIVDAASLGEIARVPLGDAVERWGAPYIVAHRADLQEALLARAAELGVRPETGVQVAGARFDAERPALVFENGTEPFDLVVGADGVHSRTRQAIGGRASRDARQTAWRATFASDHPALVPLAGSGELAHGVTAFVHPGFHMVAYPLRGGASVNFAGFTPAMSEAGRDQRGQWALSDGTDGLRHAMRATAPSLRALAGVSDAWTSWPVRTVPQGSRWSDPRGLALIGDAAHAMTPFAAQGAAMAIEDAAGIAAAIEAEGSVAAALARWEAARRARVRRVALRGAWNGFTWHVGWPAAPIRNVILKVLGPERLAAQLDWLYGYDPG
ncbi:MAG: FAD-dependent monooxygenase [Rhizobiaceae bacterium]|nr:FAD-dependent monooxygenase [Rhizobiaceae bacterium]MCV0405344.1 FAD-dependent monooxygenase [Rhizobiaceae bacterium]